MMQADMMSNVRFMYVLYSFVVVILVYSNNNHDPTYCAKDNTSEDE